MNLKIGYVVDSSTGLSKKEAKEKGMYFLPLILSINKKDYKDGEDLTSDEYYKKIKLTDEIKTSATPMGIIENVIKKASKENDFVIVYPISKEISSQWNNIQIVTKGMKNVKIINSKTIGSMIIEEINEIKKIQNQKNNIDELIDILNKNGEKWTGVLIPKTLDWLIKGGRINPAIAKMASLFKIVPIIRWKNGKLEKEGKGRIYKKTCIKSFKKMLKESSNKKIYISSGNGNKEKEIFDEIKTIKNDVLMNKIPPVIANHCGPNSIIFMIKSR